MAADPPISDPHVPDPRAPDPHRAVRIWLWIVYGFIAIMVAIGGITRLTGSGLSMVEWRPLMGALPPIGETEWLAVFDQYKQTPQFAQVNDWMSLADFQRIFFWEYLHRLLGRLIGVVFLVPWLVFVFRRRLRGPLAWRALLAFVFGGLQGVLGWYMVSSGLVDVPAVSHYRLAAHLGLAFFVANYVLWFGLDLNPHAIPAHAARPGTARATWSVLVLVALQSVYGAFMAGTRAGWLFATFPDMHGEYVPTSAFAAGSIWQNLLANPVAIHFVHRTLAYAVVIAVAWWWWRARRQAAHPRQRRIAHFVGGTLLLQFSLGVATVLFAVPVWLATAHQAAALLLLSTLVAAAHAFSARASLAPAMPERDSGRGPRGL